MYTVGKLLVAGVFAFGATTQAQTTSSNADINELRQMIAEQGQQIEAQQALLEKQQAMISRMAVNDGDWLDARRAEEVKGLIREVLSDADARAALLDDGIGAGHDGNNFYIRSNDGAFLLKVAGMLQIRHVYNSQDQSPTDDEVGGFEASRIRYGFIGNVIDPTWKYVIWTGHSNAGGDLLLDAYITKTFDGGWSVTAGQFKVPMWREWLVSEKSQQVVERSLLNGLSGSYTQGIKADYKNDNIHLTLSFNDGLGNLNTTWSATDVDFAFTGRAEWLVDGQWADYGDWMSSRGEEPVLVVGGAAHYQKGENGTNTETTDITRWTADLTWGLGGANVFVAVIGDHQESDTTDIDRLGVMVQGGVFLTDKLEVFGRYEWADLEVATDGQDDLGIVTLGGNYYVQGHRVKISADIGYGTEPVPATFSSNLTGWRTDSTDEDGQIVARTQVQLLF